MASRIPPKTPSWELPGHLRLDPALLSLSGVVCYNLNTLLRQRAVGLTRNLRDANLLARVETRYYATAIVIALVSRFLEPIHTGSRQHRLGNEKALRKIAAKLRQQIPLCVCFNPFSNRENTEILGQLNT